METFLRSGEKDVLSSIFGVGSSDGTEHVADELTEPGEREEEGAGGYSEVVHTSISGAIEIRLLQQKRKGIAHQLWPAAAFLCNFIEAHQDTVFKAHGGATRTRVLELGAGVGLVGLFLAALGCPRVVVTDLRAAMEILEANIAHNNAAAHVSAMPLDWGSPQEVAECLAALGGGGEGPRKDTGQDEGEVKLPAPEAVATMGEGVLVVVADCVYWECLFQILVDALAKLCKAGCTVLMSHVRRWKKDARFFKLCGRNGLVVEVLLETIEMVPAVNTGIPERTITRVYKISGK